MRKSKMQQAREFGGQFKGDFLNGGLDKKTLTDALVNQLGFARNTARRYSRELAREWAAEKLNINLSEFIEPRPPKKHSKMDDVRELARLFMKDYLEGQVGRGELTSLISEETGMTKGTVSLCITEEKKKWLKKYPNQKITRRFSKRGKYSKKGKRSSKFTIAQTIAKRYMPLYHQGKLSHRSIIKMFMTGCPCVEITAHSYFERLKDEHVEQTEREGAQVSGLCCQHCGKPPFPNTVRFQLLPNDN